MRSTYQILATILILFSSVLVNAAPVPSPRDNIHRSIIDISSNINVRIQGLHQDIKGQSTSPTSAAMKREHATVVKRQIPDFGGFMGVPSFGSGGGAAGIPDLGGSGGAAMPNFGGLGMPSLGGARAGATPAMPGIPGIAGALGKVPVVGSVVSSLTSGAAAAV